MLIIFLIITNIITFNEFYDNIFINRIKNKKCEHFEMEIDLNLYSFFSYYQNIEKINISLENNNKTENLEYNYIFSNSTIKNENYNNILNTIKIENTLKIIVLRTDIYKKLLIKNIVIPFLVNNNNPNKLKLRLYSEDINFKFMKWIDIATNNKILIIKKLIIWKENTYSLLINGKNNCINNLKNSYFFIKIKKIDSRNNDINIFINIKDNCKLILNKNNVNCKIKENEDFIILYFHNQVDIFHNQIFNIHILNIFNPYFLKKYYIYFEIGIDLNNKYIDQEIFVIPLNKNKFNYLNIINPKLNTVSDYEISFNNLFNIFNDYIIKISLPKILLNLNYLNDLELVIKKNDTILNNFIYYESIRGFEIKNLYFKKNEFIKIIIKNILNPKTTKLNEGFFVEIFNGFYDKIIDIETNNIKYLKEKLDYKININNKKIKKWASYNFFIKLPFELENYHNIHIKFPINFNLNLYKIELIPLEGFKNLIKFSIISNNIIEILNDINNNFVGIYINFLIKNIINEGNKLITNPFSLVVKTNSDNIDLINRNEVNLKYELGDINIDNYNLNFIQNKKSIILEILLNGYFNLDSIIEINFFDSIEFENNKNNCSNIYENKSIICEFNINKIEIHNFFKEFNIYLNDSFNLIIDNFNLINENINHLIIFEIKIINKEYKYFKNKLLNYNINCVKNCILFTINNNNCICEKCFDNYILNFNKCILKQSYLKNKKYFNNFKNVFISFLLNITIIFWIKYFLINFFYFDEKNNLFINFLYFFNLLYFLLGIFWIPLLILDNNLINYKSILIIFIFYYIFNLLMIFVFIYFMKNLIYFTIKFSKERKITLIFNSIHNILLIRFYFIIFYKLLLNNIDPKEKNYYINFILSIIKKQNYINLFFLIILFNLKFFLFLKNENINGIHFFYLLLNIINCIIYIIIIKKNIFYKIYTNTNKIINIKKNNIKEFLLFKQNLDNIILNDNLF